MTCVHKNPKTYVNIHYFASCNTLFFLIKSMCLAENFKAIAKEPFELELVRVRKRNFPKKKPFFHRRAVAFKILQICCNQSTIKKKRVKRPRNVKNTCFIKTMLNRMERFACKKCSKLAIST